MLEKQALGDGENPVKNKVWNTESRSQESAGVKKPFHDFILNSDFSIPGSTINLVKKTSIFHQAR
jgi:hypothetical protein